MLPDYKLQLVNKCRNVFQYLDKRPPWKNCCFSDYKVFLTNLVKNYLGFKFFSHNFSSMYVALIDGSFYFPFSFLYENETE